MQAQNASLFLGLMPNPHTNQPEVNLDLARMFIDQLAMIQEKTRGNLSTEEANVLRNALTNLQMAFYESRPAGRRGSVADGGTRTGGFSRGGGRSADGKPCGFPTAPAPEVPADPGGESKKRFSKSYGS